MPQCLIALGSNLGDRQGTLEAAVDEINRLSFTNVAKVSGWYETTPVGGPAGQPPFLNGAALVETSLDPRALSVGLQRVEAQAGRVRRERWAARSLDIDLLLFNDEILRTPDLAVPHPRLSFRRFVLEPAVEIAPDLVHPILGSTLRQLLQQLNSGADVCALLALRDSVRDWLAGQVASFAPGAIASSEIKTPDEARWPSGLNQFIEFTGKARGDRTGADSQSLYPKLSVVLETDEQIVAEADSTEGVAVTEASREKFSAALDAKGRGPTLALRNADRQTVQTELKAALGSVWPHL